MRKGMLLVVILALGGLAWAQRGRINALLSRETTQAEAAELQPSAEPAEWKTAERVRPARRLSSLPSAMHFATSFAS